MVFFQDHPNSLEILVYMMLLQTLLDYSQTKSNVYLRPLLVRLAPFFCFKAKFNRILNVFHDLKRCTYLLHLQVDGGGKNYSS